MDLLGALPDFVEIEIKGKEENDSRVVKLKGVYDILPKYCRNCKLQGHSEDACRILHPELRKKENKRNEGAEGGIQLMWQL